MKEILKVIKERLDRVNGLRYHGEGVIKWFIGSTEEPYIVFKRQCDKKMSDNDIEKVISEMLSALDALKVDKESHTDASINNQSFLLKGEEVINISIIPSSSLIIISTHK